MPRPVSDADWVRIPEDFAARYRRLGLWDESLLGDLATAHAAATPHHPAVSDARHRWDYATLEAEATALASGWVHAGIGPGHTVLLQLPNCAEFVAVLLSLFKVGAVPIMGLPAHRLSELRSFAQQADIAAYVSAEAVGDLDQLAAGDALRAEHPELVHVVVRGAGAPDTTPDTGTQTATHGGSAQTVPDAASSPHAVGPLAPGAGTRIDYATLRAAGRSRPVVVTGPQAGDVALLQLSGGSTGTPKLIPRTHADYLYSVRGSVPLCGIMHRSVYLCALPCAHNFAMSSAGILGQLVAGGHTVMAPDPSAATAFPLIEEHGVTVAGVVPPVALLWLAAAPRARRAGTDPLASLELLQVGGAKLSVEAARRITPELGCELQQVFGMAEGLVNYTRLGDPAELVATHQGTPISTEDEVRVVDDEDRDVPSGTPGHLLARGPYTIRGYFRAPEHNARAFTADGFYRTGDLVTRTERGEITVVGRAKDQINRGGEKIAAEELENHLLAHPHVFEAAVVGEPDRLLGERVVAHLIPRPGAPAEAWGALRPAQLTEEVRRFLQERQVATYKLPDRVLLVEQLPRTAVGKTSAASLRESVGAAGAAR